uniref:Uncharacterized protein n=1 Tax=Anguilla anguilla TaxID=7936 RepID=A0A0E9TLD1_ANGAN
MMVWRNTDQYPVNSPDCKVKHSMCQNYTIVPIVLHFVPL